jgi:hypothetical protein
LFFRSTGYPSAVPNFNALVNGDSRLQIRWSLPLDTGRGSSVASEILSFTLVRALDSNFATGVSSYTVTSAYLYNDGVTQQLIPGTVYFYKLLSRNLACGSSAYCGNSAVINVTAVGKN